MCELYNDLSLADFSRTVGGPRYLSPLRLALRY